MPCPVSSPSNATQCDVCMALPADHYVRRDLPTLGGYPYRRTRANRRRIDPTYWPFYGPKLAAAGISQAAWAGRYVCPECASRFVQALNA